MRSRGSMCALGRFAGAMVLLLVTCKGWAVERTWQPLGTGNWHEAGNWYPTGYPQEIDTAIIDQGVSRIENPALAATALYIYLGSASETNGSLFIGGRGLVLGGTMYVGYNSRGTVTQRVPGEYGVSQGSDRAFGVHIGVAPG